MSYTANVSGHVDSKKAEAEVLSKFADFVEAVGANGSFGFSGMHFSVAAGAPEDAVAKAREIVSEYNASADVDDRVPVAGELVTEEVTETTTETTTETVEEDGEASNLGTAEVEPDSEPEGEPSA